MVEYSSLDPDYGRGVSRGVLEGRWVTKRATSSCSGGTPAKELCPALLNDRVQLVTDGRKRSIVGKIRQRT